MDGGEGSLCTPQSAFITRSDGYFDQASHLRTRMKLFHTAAVFGILCITGTVWSADAKPIPIAEVKQDGPVDFQKQILLRELEFEI